jgi:hypothetical protein
MQARQIVIISRMNYYDDEPSHSTSSEHTGIVAAAIVMAVIGWGGLWLLVTTTLPTAFPRWLFFVLLYLAVTGTVLPFVRFLNMRFSRSDLPPSGGVILRQSIWVGVFVVACAWLQIPRVLNPVIAFFLALSLTVIEVFLRVRELDQSSDT